MLVGDGALNAREVDPRARLARIRGGARSRAVRRSARRMHYTSSVTKTMQAAVVETLGKPRVLREWDIPTPGPGQIVIKTEACGVCLMRRA
jgi:hypothetical protein